jgi:hypothetical protein
MVLIRKTTTGPANSGHFQFAKRANDIVPNPTGIGNRGIRANPNAFIEAVPQIFRKLAEDIPVDLHPWFGGVDGYANILRKERRNENHRKKRDAKYVTETSETHGASQIACQRVVEWPGRQHAGNR